MQQEGRRGAGRGAGAWARHVPASRPDGALLSHTSAGVLYSQGSHLNHFLPSRSYLSLCLLSLIRI